MKKYFTIIFFNIVLVIFSGAMSVVLAVDDSFVGLPVTDIKFKSNTNLSDRELSRGFLIKKGKPFTKSDLEESINVLILRNIFSKVTYQLEPLADGVSILLDLQSNLIVTAVNFRDNFYIPVEDLKRVARIPLGSTYSKALAAEARARIKKLYLDRGYNSARVLSSKNVNLSLSDVIVNFRVIEGKQSLISAIEIEGEIPEEAKSRVEEVKKTFINSQGDLKTAKSAKQKILFALRSEVYLQALAKLESVELDPATQNVIVKISIKARTPLSIYFSGNTVFTAEQLLKPLKLASRTVPFTPNAIESLNEKIELLYQKNGYFFAEVTSNELIDEQKKIVSRRVFQINIIEGPKVILKSLRFSGNDHFSDSELRYIVKLRPKKASFWGKGDSGYIVKSDLAEDLLRIRKAYQDAGYFESTEDFELNYEEAKNEVSLKIIIFEGRRSKIESVDLVWVGMFPELGEDATTEFDPKLLKIHSDLKPNRDWFIFSNFDKESASIKKQISEFGYPLAKVSYNADVRNGSVEFIATPGPHVSIGQIILQGNRLTHDKVLSREILVKEGDNWSPPLIKKSEQQLFGLGIFNGASLYPLDGTLDQPVEDLGVEVKEREAGRLSAGTGLNTEDGLNLNAEIRQSNFHGEGDSLSVGFDTYIKTGGGILDAGRARITHTNNHLLDTNFDLVTELYAQFDSQLFEVYKSDRFGLQTTLGRELTEHLTSYFGFSTYLENLRDVDSDVIIGPTDEGENFINLISGRLSYDRRNEPFNPSKGYKLDLETVVANNIADAGANFYGGSALATHFYPLSTKLVWANKFSTDYLAPYGDSDTIPISSRFFLGGRNSLRGFERNSVGPRGIDNNVAGGDLASNASTELQWQFAERLVFVGFLDAGQSVLLEEGTFGGDPLTLSDLKYSPGFGFRYITPIGPLSIEYGFALNRESGESPGRFIAGIGGAF
jgi:outer membrane protein insertion porin family